MRFVRRGIVCAAGIAAALGPAAAVGAAQVKSTSTVQRSVSVKSPLLRTVSEEAAIDSFRQRTVAHGYPAHLDRYPQSVDVWWHARPRATGYQVVRSWSATGPWVAATPRASGLKVAHEQIDGLLPDRTLYFRVVALGERNGRVAAIDSSNAAIVHTAIAVVPANRGVPGVVHLAVCTATPQAATSLVWHSVPDATGYRIIQGIAPTTNRDFTKSPASSGLAESQQIATFVVRDTAFSQSGVPTGDYIYAVEPLFHMLNDSQEVWATAFGGAVELKLPTPSAENFCASQ